MRRALTGVIFVVALGAASLQGCAEAQTEAAPEANDALASEWQGRARTDVLAAYAAYVDSHPGMYDLENAGFPAQLSAARAAGLAVAADTVSEADYRRALAAFSAELQDGHALAYAQPAGGDDKRVWPGFAALWRGDGLLVRTPDPADPLHEAEIVACDGTPIRPFLEGALLTHYFRPDEAGQWWRRPSQLFLTPEGMMDGVPDTCTFELKGGTQVTQTLDWTEPDASEVEFFGVSAHGSREPTALAEPREGIFFIGLQDFQPDAEGVTAFGTMYESVRERRAALLGARALVLDLRRNNGGSSSWSKDLAHILWGREAVESRDPGGAAVLWRTSDGNIRHVREGSVRIRELGHAELADEWISFAGEMEAARDRGEPLWQQYRSPPNTAAPAPTDFGTPVYVITHGGCASACLDALDYFTRFGNTTLIGAPTSADSTYMEVRLADLPAGPGKIVIPVKVYSGRSRGWGEVYTPDILMTDLDWSTDTFLDWIEADLETR